MRIPASCRVACANVWTRWMRVRVRSGTSSGVRLCSWSRPIAAPDPVPTRHVDETIRGARGRYKVSSVVSPDDMASEMAPGLRGAGGPA